MISIHKAMVEDLQKILGLPIERLVFTYDLFQGREQIGNDVKGALCIRTSIPSMSRTIYGHHQRFLDTYYNPFKGVVHFFLTLLDLILLLLLLLL